MVFLLLHLTSFPVHVRLFLVRSSDALHLDSEDLTKLQMEVMSPHSPSPGVGEELMKAWAPS